MAGDCRIYRDKKFCTRKLVTLCSASHTAQIHGHSQPLGPSESWGVALPGGSLPWIGSKRQAPGQSGAGALSWGRVSRGAAGGASQGSCSPSSGPPFSRRLLPLVLPARRPDGTWPPPLWQQQDGASAAPLRSSSGAATRQKGVSTATGRESPRAGNLAGTWRALQVRGGAGPGLWGPAKQGGLPAGPVVGCRWVG